MRTSLADQTVWEVPLKGGGKAQGTERELDQRFRGKDWRKVARQVQAARDTTYDSQIIEDMDLQDDPRPGRLPTSVRTYGTVAGRRYRIEDHSTVIPKRARAVPPITTNAPVYTDNMKPAKQQQSRRWSVWFFVGVGMLCMLALYVAGSWVYVHFQAWQSYSTYGYPPTWQCDTVVGHNGDSKANPSHFIFLNLNGHPEVIEIPAGDETKQKTYLLPQLVTDGFDTIPITGSFADVNGDGKPDMIVNIQDQRIVWINTGEGFRPLKPGEHVTLPQN